MTPQSRSLCTCAWLVALASVVAAGCLCPPCPGKGPVAGPGAAAASVAPGARLVIWDGDGAGAGAQSWESCDQKPACKVKVGVDPGSGTNGSTSLKVHGEGPGFIGMGWNLFGWYPANAGIDLTPYSHLTFQIRVVAKSAQEAPDPASVAVLLGCSSNNFDSADAPLERYAKGFQDGKWHKVAIPVTALLKGAGAKFDPQSFWEFRLRTWSGAPRNFDIYIDDIAAEKQ